MNNKMCLYISTDFVHITKEELNKGYQMCSFDPHTRQNGTTFRRVTSTAQL